MAGQTGRYSSLVCVNKGPRGYTPQDQCERSLQSTEVLAQLNEEVLGPSSAEAFNVPEVTLHYLWIFFGTEPYAGAAASLPARAAVSKTCAQ